jgi:hypothetical protein
MIAQFRKMVDREVSNIAGVGIDDLPDFDLWNYFDEGMSQEELLESARCAARDLLEEEGFPFDEDGFEDYE